jgi:hypothetical protein
MPVTCQETFTFGLSMRMVNWLWLISEATMACELPDHGQANGVAAELLPRSQVA